MIGARWTRRLVVIATLASGASCASLGRRSRDEAPRWLGTWEAAPQLTEPRNMPPAPGLNGSTLRQVFRATVGGSRWRLHVSNEFGDEPIVITSARIARSAGRDAIDPGSSVTVAFSGHENLTIPPGVSVYSEPFELPCGALCDLTVSLHFASVPSGLTGHPGSRTTSFILPGDHTADRSLPNAVPTEHWYVISGLDVMAPVPAGAVVILGNSIVDGRGSGTDKNNRWPDNLARRLQANSATARVSVLNAGIGGNTVLRGGLGPTALSRFRRDVLSQVGARWLIVCEGVNDIGGARGADSSASIARQLIEAYHQMIQRAHEQGIRVYGATILPFAGSQYGSPDHEAARQTVNAWIRDSRAFDAVIDFDALMGDPADPTKLRADANTGDHLHPNELGYRLMADAIDLSLFALPVSGGAPSRR